MIETQRLIIREFEMGDANDLSKYRSKEEVAYYQTWNQFPLIKAQRRIEHCLEHPLSNQIGMYQLAITLKDTKKLIGDFYIEVNSKSSFTLGYTFDSDYWGKGYASEALRVLLRYMKETYNYKMVYCYVYIDNVRSIRLLENNGFIEYERSIIMGDIGFKREL